MTAAPGPTAPPSRWLLILTMLVVIAFTAGRLVGSAMPYIVPLLAAHFHNLFTAMMFGVVGSILCLIFALLLPETAGRKFAVIEGKDRGPGT